MADRDLMALLYESTVDDDSKVSEKTINKLAKAASKSKEPALRDMASWLLQRLGGDSPVVKVKVRKHPRPLRSRICVGPELWCLVCRCSAW